MACQQIYQIILTPQQTFALIPIQVHSLLKEIADKQKKVTTCMVATFLYSMIQTYIQGRI
jgi:hypothetical protein